MKILSYNVFGVKNAESPAPIWEERQKNLKRILNTLLSDKEVKVVCLQEVNQNNIELLSNTLKDNGFEILEKFPMITQNITQYNIIGVKNEKEIEIESVFCLPHGKDKEYKKLEEQIIDYGMSDYRTTVFVTITYKDETYLIGNIHTDYISVDGKIKGMIKTLDYMDSINAQYKMVVGDVNMISHMAEVYNILKIKNNYTTISRNSKFDVTDNSYHGYGKQEQINVDFAFIESKIRHKYEYKIIKQKDMMEEGSDHRPVIITIS